MITVLHKVTKTLEFGRLHYQTEHPFFSHKDRAQFAEEICRTVSGVSNSI